MMMKWTKFAAMQFVVATIVLPACISRAVGATHDDGLDPLLSWTDNLPLGCELNGWDPFGLKALSSPSQSQSKPEATPGQFPNLSGAGVLDHVSARRQAQENTEACPAGSWIPPSLVPIGLHDRDIIPDSAFTASSFHAHASHDFRPSEARLNNSMWWASAKQPGESSEINDEWVRVDLGRNFRVRAIDTQGTAATNRVGPDFWTSRFTVSWSGDSRCEDSIGELCSAASAWENFANSGDPQSSCASCTHREPICVTMCTRIYASAADDHAETGCTFIEAGSNYEIYREDGNIREFDANTEAGDSVVRNLLARTTTARIITIHVVDAHMWPNLRMELYTDCILCGAGKYSLVADSTVCAPCTPGTHSEAGSTECSPCPAGTHDHDYDPATPCAACPEGTHSDSLGATECAMCATGTHATQQSSSCSPCAVGMYDDDLSANTACVVCEAGRYSTNEGAVSCDGGCPSGTYLSAGTLECIECSAGRTDDDNDAGTPCTCGSGSYDECMVERRLGVLWETWENLPGTEVDDLRNHDSYPDSPTYSSLLGQADLLETDSDRHDNAADRLTSYFIPPLDGEYTFKIIADDRGELWLGPSEPEAQRIAFNPGRVGPAGWDRFPEQTSAPQLLRAQQPYFLQAFAKESSMGDHLAIGVIAPNEIGGTDNHFPIPVDPFLHLLDFSPVRVISQGKPTRQSNEVPSGTTSGRAVDGDASSNFADGSCTETQTGDETAQYWQVDLGWDALIDRVEIYHRSDCCSERLSGARVILSDTSDFLAGATCANLTANLTETQPEVVRCNSFSRGRFVTIYSVGSSSVSLCEVEVYSTTPGVWDSSGSMYYNCRCSQCPSGQSDDDSTPSTACVDCAQGRYSTAPGASNACPGVCDPGTYSTEGSSAATDCHECEAGQVDDDRNASTPCRDCSTGKYTSGPATMSTCVDCATGMYSSVGATECAFCNQPGFHASDDGSCIAVPCPAGSEGAGGADPCTCMYPEFAGTIAWDEASNSYTGECSEHTITEITTQSLGCTPEVGRIAVHEMLYCDRHFIFSKVPTFLVGAAYIRASNTDKFATHPEFMCFDVAIESNIYVLYNKQRTGTDAPSPPTWLTSQFELLEPDECPDANIACTTSSIVQTIEYRDSRTVMKKYKDYMVGVSIDKEIWTAQVGPGQVCIGGNQGARDNFVVAAAPRMSVGSSHPWSARTSCEDERWIWHEQPFSFSGATMEKGGNVYPEDNVQAPPDGHSCETIEAAGWCTNGDMGANPPLGLGGMTMVTESWGRRNLVDSSTGFPADNAFNYARMLNPTDACCACSGGTTRPDRSVMNGTERMVVALPSRPGALSDHGCEPTPELLGWPWPWAHLGGNNMLRTCLDSTLGLNTPECGFQAGNCCPTGPNARLVGRSGLSSPERADCEPMEQWFAEGNSWRPALEADRVAVVALGLGLGNFSSKWDLDKDPCVDQVSFTHLACDHSGSIGRVFSIAVLLGVAQTPVGTIAPEIGNLTALRSFWIHNQATVSGTIPSAVGSLTDLRNLGLSGTTISGSIPNEMRNCHRLQYFELPPAISGTISSNYWDGWSELISFKIESSQISGTLPTRYSRKLRRLSIYSTRLSGTISEQIGSAEDMILAQLQSNSISGTLPAAIGNNTKMHRLMLSDNMISGTIPVELAQMQNLNAFGLTANPVDAPTRHPNFTTLSALFSRVDHLDVQMSRKHLNLLNVRPTPQPPIFCTMYEQVPCDLIFSFEDQDSLQVPLGSFDLWIHMLAPDVPGGARDHYWDLSAWTQPGNYQWRYLEHSARMLNKKNGEYYFEFPREWMPEVRDYIFAVSRGSRLDAASYVLMPLVIWHGGGQYIRMSPRKCLDPLATVSDNGLLCNCAPGSQSSADDQCELCVSVGPNYATTELLPGLHTSCRPCEEGLIPNYNRTACVPCEAGRVPDSTGGTCELCEIGTTRAVRMRTCEPCPRGWIASDDHTHCEMCPAGRQSDELGDSCVQCPIPLYSTAGQPCQRCPQHQVGNTVGELRVDSAGANACRCDESFYNASTALHVCFADGYDDDQVVSSQDLYESSRTASGQECNTCPTDVTGESCTVCEAGALPSVQAGYTMRLASTAALSQNDVRRRLSARPEILSVFRCHIDLELARKRCPANSTACAVGYEGRLCGRCIEGYGMSVKRECQPCEASGYTLQSMLLLLVIAVGVGIGLFVLAYMWKAFTLKHFLRCAFQPLRISITYTQVTGQLGDVLDFTYPGIFGDVMEALRPITDFWNLFFRALGPSECFGLRGFLSRWLLRVVGLPIIAAVAVTIFWLYDRRTNGSANAAIRAKSHSFLAVFLCYPTISIIAVAPFICQSVGPNESLLEADDSVTCESAQHRSLQVASLLVILVVSLGLPIAFGIILARSARTYERLFRSKNSAIAKRMSAELFGHENDHVSVAEWVIRDITVGRDYCFLMDAYKPEYLYWEVLDMLRKLALGALVLAAGRGTVGQLSVAILLSFAFFALQMGTMPYKSFEDNVFRATTELHVFIVITTALVLKNDLSWEQIGVSTYDNVLFFSFVLLVPMAGLVSTFSKLRGVKSVLKQQQQNTDSAATSNTEDAFAALKLCFQTQALGLANDSDRSRLRRFFVDGWSARKGYVAFLSHFKNEAAGEARMLKTELVRSFRMKEDEVFLDSDNLLDLRALLDNVKNSDALILLYTKGVMSRPWCILELVTAVQHNVPIVIVHIQNNNAGTPDTLTETLQDFSAYLATSNPDAEATLMTNGTTAQAAGDLLQQPLLAAKDTWELAKLVFDPAVSSSLQQQQTGQIAQALVQRVCPENADFLLDAMASKPIEEWPGRQTTAVNIVSDETNKTVSQQAERIRDWLVRRVHLDPSQIQLTATHHDPGDVASTDICRMAETDCVLFLQSAQVLKRPQCLARLYSAAARRVPICSIVLKDPTGRDHQDVLYNFEQAVKTLRDLSSSLDKHDAEALEHTAPISTVEVLLSAILPNIISKPLSIDAPSNEMEAQMTEIEHTMRTFVVEAMSRQLKSDPTLHPEPLVPTTAKYARP